jgi:non-lysosomal glucosylceramidase
MYILYVVELFKWGNDVSLLKELWPVVAQAASWQMNVSADKGVPEHLCNTYDILQPTKHDQVSYNSAFHLAAMKGCMVLAAAIDDGGMGSACAKAFTRGQLTLDNNQWIAGTDGAPGHYSFNTDDNSSLMVDSLYAQVLAYSTGLGLLVSSEDHVREHLATEAAWADTPYGLVVSTTGTTHTLAEIWQMGSPDWATLNIHTGMDPTTALEQPKKSLGLWNRVINDQWNTAGIASPEGQPWITSHYGFFMVEWHLILALSGQQANLPAGVLGFNFTDTTLETASYPVLLPGVLGTISASPTMRNLTISFGSIQGITRLSVGSHVYGGGSVTLSAGQSLSW